MQIGYIISLCISFACAAGGVLALCAGYYLVKMIYIERLLAVFDILGAEEDD